VVAACPPRGVGATQRRETELLRQHWGEFEVVRAMKLRLLPALDVFGSWKNAKLMSRLELRFHCRSALVNAINEAHVAHALSSHKQGNGQAGDACSWRIMCSRLASYLARRCR